MQTPIGSVDDTSDDKANKETEDYPNSATVEPEESDDRTSGENQTIQLPGNVKNSVHEPFIGCEVRLNDHADNQFLLTKSSLSLSLSSSLNVSMSQMNMHVLKCKLLYSSLVC